MQYRCGIICLHCNSLHYYFLIDNNYEVRKGVLASLFRYAFVSVCVIITSGFFFVKLLLVIKTNLDLCVSRVIISFNYFNFINL